MNIKEDIDCAKSVMGWPVVASVYDSDGFDGCVREDGAVLKRAAKHLWLAWSPSTSANDDFDVLQYALQKWSYDKQLYMAGELRSKWYTREKVLGLGYEVGDYCLAAITTDRNYFGDQAEEKFLPSGGTI